MILLHAFVKKQQKTPKPDLDLAKDRLKQMRGQQAVLQAAEKKARRPVRK